MKRYITILTMLVLAAVACKKEFPFEDSMGETLRANIGGPQGKVEFNPTSGKFAWGDPDEIALHTTSGTFKTLQVSPSGVFTFLPEGSETRDGYALYPASLAGGTVEAPAVTLPDSYDIAADGMGGWYPTPLIAVNDPEVEDLWFYHVGALLRLTLNGVPAGTSTITISHPSMILSGDFVVQDPSSKTPFIDVDHSSATSRSVTFHLPSPLAEKTDGIVLNIPLPVCELHYIHLYFDDEAEFVRVDIPTGTFARARGRQVEFEYSSS